jgi:hypothetical protein
MNRNKKIAKIIFDKLDEFAKDNRLIPSWVENKWYDSDDNHNIRITFDDKKIDPIIIESGFDRYDVLTNKLDVNKIMKYLNTYIYYYYDNRQSKKFKLWMMFYESKYFYILLSILFCISFYVSALISRFSRIGAGILIGVCVLCFIGCLFKFIMFIDN